MLEEIFFLYNEIEKVKLYSSIVFGNTSTDMNVIKFSSELFFV
jgi:hypothetical protein